MILVQEAKDKINAKVRTESLLNAVRENRILTLVVEPSSKCNLTCSFCDLHSGRIQNIDKKYKGIMTSGTFRILVDQLTGLSYRLRQLQIHGNGEPLLNKDIDKFIAYASEKNIADSIRLTTNGTMLTPRILGKLLDSGVDEIRVSLDVADKSLYSQFKGKDLYEKVYKNLINAIEKIENAGGASLVIKYPLPSPDQQYGITQDFVDSVFKTFASFAKDSPTIHLLGMPVITLPLGVLLDDLVHEKCVANEAPCEIPFYSLYVKYDGRVSVCCADFTDILDVGNIHQQHLGEIITGERLREFRIKHLQRNFS